MSQIVWFLLTLLLAQVTSDLNSKSQILRAMLKSDICSPIYISISDPDFNSETESNTNILANQHDNVFQGVLKFTIPMKNTEKSFSRPNKQFSQNCFTSILILPENFSITPETTSLVENLLTPSKVPLTYRNSDKYIFITTHQDQLYQMFSFNFFRILNFAIIVLDSGDSDTIEFYQICHYCYENGRISLIQRIQRSQIENQDFTHIFTDASENFHGYQMKTSFPPIQTHIGFNVLPNGSVELTRGLYNVMVRHMARKLNFTNSARISTAGNTGLLLPNGSWTGTVGDVITHRADFGLLTAGTYKRYQYASFSAAVSYEFVSFLYKDPEKFFTWKTIYWPFKGALWAAIFASFVLILIISTGIHALFLRKKYSKTKDLIWNLRIGRTGASFVNCLLDQGTAYPKNWSESFKVLLTFWLFFAIIISSTYRSKLVSLMAFPIYEKVPGDFEELAASTIPYGLLDKGGGASYMLFKVSETPAYATIFKSMTREHDSLECMLKVIRERFICITYTSAVSYHTTQNFLKFLHSPPNLASAYAFYIPVGLVFEKRSLFLHRFNQIIMSSFDMGLLNHWLVRDKAIVRKEAFEAWKVRRDARKKRKENKTPINTEEEGTDENEPDEIRDSRADRSTPLSMNHVKGSFVILSVGSILSSSAFILEFVGHTIKRVASRYRNKGGTTGSTASSVRSTSIEHSSTETISTKPSLTEAIISVKPSSTKTMLNKRSLTKNSSSVLLP